MAENPQPEQPEQRDPRAHEEPSRDLVPWATEPTEPAAPQDAPPPAHQLDEEQWRQFQEFQRFQAYLHYSQSQGAPPDGGQPTTGQQAPAQQPSPESQAELVAIQEQLGQVMASQQRTERELNPPLWKKVLRSHWLYRVLVLVIVIVLASWAYNHFFGSSDKDNPPVVPAAPPGHQGGLNAAPPRPDRTIQSVYAGVATKGDATCNLFTTSGKRQFARDFHARNCLDALGKLRSRVTDSNSYSILHFQDAIVHKTAKTATISSCRADITGGPSLGAFTLQRQPLGGWYVSAHRPEQCSSTRSGTEAPSATAPTPTH